jgi:hypothetical protein
MAKDSMDKFWQHYIAVGKEVLEQGARSGYSMSLIEVKFQKAEPSVMVTANNTSVKFPSNEAAIEALVGLIKHDELAHFDGSRTITQVWQKGTLSRMLIDNYGNTLL